MASSAAVASLLAELTLDEKCTMLSGRTAFVIPGCERLGIPEWACSDGPVGVRGREGQHAGLVVPGPSALAATWDPDLVEAVGAAIGVECLDRNVDLLLAPTTNLHRSPRGGRHFESYSEEPLLSSRLAVGYIRGVQSVGVGACVKHYVANDQEHERMTIDVDVDERTLREVYLPPFEAAVTEAGVWSVMGVYNFVNGVHACAHRELLVDVLKDEWGFEGLVVSDWYAMKDAVAPANGGLDLEMPGPGRYWGDGRLADAVASGAVDEATVDEKVCRILTFLEWRGRLATETDHEERSEERPEHRVLVRRAAAAGTVLIRNAGDALPLRADRTVAVIGELADRTSAMGGGSARLRAHRRPSLLASLRQRLGDRLVGFAPGTDLRRFPARVPAGWLDGVVGARVELFGGVGFDGDLLRETSGGDTAGLWLDDPEIARHGCASARATAKVQVPASGAYRLFGSGIGTVVLYVDGVEVGRTTDDDPIVMILASTAQAVVELDAARVHEIRVEAVPAGAQENPSAGVDLRLEAVSDHEGLLADAAQLAAAADTAVVVVGSTSQWESEGADRDSLELPAGQSALVARVAAANPRTVVVLNCGAPMQLPWLDDVAGVLLGWYPGQEGGDALADVLLGDVDPGGRMPTTWARREEDTPSSGHYPGTDGVVRYGEGVFVGYRHYDRHGIEPLIPFGHGGSYTTFAWGTPSVTGSGTDLVVAVPITNTGDRVGSDVVQVYVAPASLDEDRPDKVLAGFAKVDLRPGETATATVEVAERAFQVWDVDEHAWRVVPGGYELIVAASAVDVRHRVPVDVDVDGR